MSDVSRFYGPHRIDYPRALAEIRAGRKQTHWIWYIFPQLRGLGYSHMAVYFGLEDIDEARAYWADPMLGPDLLEISRALLALDTCDPEAVLGDPDDKKVRSCMTLFAQAAPEEPVFRQVLEKFYGGEEDRNTLYKLKI